MLARSLLLSDSESDDGSDTEAVRPSAEIGAVAAASSSSSSEASGDDSGASSSSSASEATMRRRKGRDWANRVPHDCLEIIFRKLEALDVLACGRVCKTWWFISLLPRLWERLYTRDFPAQARSLAGVDKSTLKGIYCREIRLDCKTAAAGLVLTAEGEPHQRAISVTVPPHRFRVNFEVKDNIEVNTEISVDRVVSGTRMEGMEEMWARLLRGGILCASRGVRNSVIYVGGCDLAGQTNVASMIVQRAAQVLFPSTSLNRAHDVVVRAVFISESALRDPLGVSRQDPVALDAFQQPVVRAITVTRPEQLHRAFLETNDFHMPHSHMQLFVMTVGTPLGQRQPRNIILMRYIGDQGAAAGLYSTWLAIARLLSQGSTSIVSSSDSAPGAKTRRVHPLRAVLSTFLTSGERTHFRAVYVVSNNLGARIFVGRTVAEARLLFLISRNESKSERKRKKAADAAGQARGLYLPNLS